jgi:hypothetical protein
VSVCKIMFVFDRNIERKPSHLRQRDQHHSITPVSHSTHNSIYQCYQCLNLAASVVAETDSTRQNRMNLLTNHPPPVINSSVCCRPKEPPYANGEIIVVSPIMDWYLDKTALSWRVVKIASEILLQLQALIVHTWRQVPDSFFR